jgi:hypothetical protein
LPKQNLSPFKDFAFVNHVTLINHHLRSDRRLSSSDSLAFPSPLWGEGARRPDEVRPVLNNSLPAHPFPIAGFSHYDGDHELPSLREGSLLTLRPEPGNPHDMHAVEILHGQAKLGYVPRFCNRPVSQLLPEGVALTCEIERVDPTSPPWEAVSVRLSIATNAAPPQNERSRHAESG